MDIKVAHKVIFNHFMAYLSSEVVKKQLKTARDILPRISYTYIKSPDNLHIGRAILSKGNMFMPENCDAQLNLEYSINRITHVQIMYHIKEKELNNLKSWILDK